MIHVQRLPQAVNQAAVVGVIIVSEIGDHGAP
jgi:hypothetical protein